MKTLPCLACCIALTGWTLGPVSAQSLSIRLVEASRAVAPSSSALADVADILNRNLPFASYTLQDSRTLSLPANQTESLGGFSISCSGTARELKVVVRRRGQVLISTILRLQEGIPVMLGGFPSANGRQIFIFLTH